MSSHSPTTKEIFRALEASHHSLTLRLYFLLAVAALLFAELLLTRAADGFWNSDGFPALTGWALLSVLATGLRFDAAALSMLMLLPVLLLLFPLPVRFDRLRFWLATGVLLLTTLPLLAMGWIDIELVRYTRARMTVSSLFLYGEGTWSPGDFVGDYWPLIVTGVVALLAWVVAMILLCRKASSEPNVSESFSWTWVYPLIALVLVAALLVIGVRGGISNSKPLNTVDTHPNMNLGNWALNTPFTFIRGARTSSKKIPKYFSDENELLSLLNANNGSPQIPSAVIPFRREQTQNVVIIMMESLSSGYMGPYDGLASFTPFIDELAQKSLFFPNAYANAKRSIDGVPAVLAAIPALTDEPFLSSPYANAAFEGIGTTLAAQGYNTAFFHGAKRGSMFLDKFALRAGFQHHFSREDFPNPEEADTSWGIPDEPFFQFVVQKADSFSEEGKPFALAVFSLSAHFPFNVPERYLNTLPEGPIRMLKSQAYADLALQRFFATASRKKWYPNTLFVITADHGSGQYRDSFRADPLGEWRIPIIFFHPEMRLPDMHSEDPVQQIDILPSVLDFLAITPEHTIPLGRSVFQIGTRVAVIRVGEGFFAVQKASAVFEPDNGGEPIGTVRGSATRSLSVPKELMDRAHATEQYYYEALQRRQLYP